MTKPIFTAFVVIASSLVACFGSGPTPASPSEARVVFAVTIPPASDLCSGSAIYVGDVALASSTGYAVTWPYTPQNNCNGNNGNNGQVAGPQALYSFPLDGSHPDGTPVPNAFDNPTTQSNTSNLTPRIVANDSGPSVLEVASNGQLEIDPGEEELFDGGSSVNDQPIAIVLDDDSNTYIAGAQITGNFADPNSPVFPSSMTPSPSTVTVGLVQPSSSGTMTGVGSANLVTPTSTQMVFAELKTPVVVDGSDNFYYFATGSGSASTDMTIDQLTSTGSSSVLAMVDQQASGWAAVGLAYNANGILAWAMAPPPPVTPPPSLGQVGCEIDSYDFATKQATRALLTDKFTCMDAAVDNGDIYFTIVELESSNGCNSCSPVEHGAGIGRVSFDGTTFESVALGISAQAAGPRRVYIESSVLYVVDPFTIAAIQEDALDGKHAFTK